MLSDSDLSGAYTIGIRLLDSFPDALVTSAFLACCRLGEDSTCDFTSSIWGLAAGLTGLILYEPISSQID